MVKRIAWIVVAIGCHRAPRAAEPTAGATPVARAPGNYERGRYVAQIAGCITCHGATLAGGREEKLPNGSVWRAPNITPDQQTGIGMWTDGEIIVAIRQGVRPDHNRLAPIMPYPFYHHMTDDDAKAVVAFLRAQPAVEHRVPRNMNLGIKPVVLPPAKGNIDPGDPKGHGEYLANLMHCAACHGADFSGGMQFEIERAGTVISPNITSDPDTGIGKWSADDVVAAIRTMTDPEGHPIRPPMADYLDAWSRLPDFDAQSVAAFVKSIPPVKKTVEGHHHEVSQQP